MTSEPSPGYPKARASPLASAQFMFATLFDSKVAPALYLRPHLSLPVAAYLTQERGLDLF